MFNDANLQANTEKFPQEIPMGFKKSTIETMFRLTT